MLCTDWQTMVLIFETEPCEELEIPIEDIGKEYGYELHE